MNENANYYKHKNENEKSCRQKWHKLHLIKYHPQAWGQCRNIWTSTSLQSSSRLLIWLQQCLIPHASENRSRLFTGYNLCGLCGNMVLLKFRTIKKLYNIKTKTIHFGWTKLYKKLLPQNNMKTKTKINSRTKIALQTSRRGSNKIRRK